MSIKIARVQTVDRLINQIQQNIAGVLEPLFADPLGSFVYSLTGFASNQSSTAYYQMGTSQSAVTIYINGVSATSNATTMTMTGLPSKLWPTQQQVCLLRVQDNGTVGVGSAVVAPSGLVTFYKDANASVFTASGTKGLSNCTFTYIRGI